MTQRSIGLIVAMGLSLSAGTANLFAQGRGGFGGGGGGGFGGGGFGGNPGAPGMVNTDTLKTDLQASDEEWKVIGPKLRLLMSAKSAVQADLVIGMSNGQQPQQNFGGPGGGFGGPGGRGGGPGGNGSFEGPAANSGGDRGGRGGFGGGRGGRGGRGGFGPDGGGFGPDGGGGFGPPDQQGFGPPDFNDNNGPTTRPDMQNGDNFARGPRGQGNFNGPGNFGGGPDGFNPGGGGRGGRGGRGGGPGGFGGPMSNPVQAALTDLKTAIDDESSTPEQLAQKAAAYRAAKAKAKEDLASAKKELLELLTDDQKTVLNGMGILD